MSVPKYTNRGPLEVTAHLNLDSLAGKSVIITGGASGLGKAYSEAFAAAGAYVTIADIDESTGAQVASKLSTNSQFVKCDVRNWEEQVAVFEQAIKNSPHNSCDIVIANAGIAGSDALYTLDDPSLPPVKPDLRILDINLTGLVYTAKLAMHYFRRQKINSSRDRCLIIKSSLAGYLDQAGTVQYMISKFGGRALMRCLRRTSWQESIRVNAVAPWYIRTPIIGEEAQERLSSRGIEFALEEDAAKAMLKISSDTSVNGRCLGVVPRTYAPEGYMDLNQDDFSEDSPLHDWQELVLRASHRIPEPPAAQ